MCTAKLTLHTVRHLQQCIRVKHKLYGTHGLKAQTWNPPGQFMPLIWYRRTITVIQILSGWRWTLDFHEQSGRDAGSARAMGREGEGNIGHLHVWCYNGNNYRTAWALFVKHPGLNRNDYVKTLASLGFWLCHSPWTIVFHKQIPKQSRSLSLINQTFVRLCLVLN